MKEKIHQLIAEGEIDIALDQLVQLDSDFILLKSRWSGLRRDQSQGILTTEYFRMERNRIAHAILDMVNRKYSMQEQDLAKSNSSPLSNNQRLANHSPKPLKVFISYSKRDKELRDELDIHLSTLKRQQYIDTWHDQDILPGDAWDAEIRQELHQADIVLFLISANFLATDYIMDIELPQALGRRAEGETTIIPIILRPCDWEGTRLGQLMALPQKGKPITSWSSRDEAWTEVVRGIKRVIDKRYA